MTTVMNELQKTEDLLALVARETGKEAVELDCKLDALGVDSLEFVSLIQAVEEKFGIEIAVSDYGTIETLRHLRERI